MAWELPLFLRPIMRSLSYYLDLGQSAAQALQSYLSERFHRPVEEARQALPEAVRATSFAEYVRALGESSTLRSSRTFGQQWFASARGLWYSAYGRAPTATERPWAYTRPNQYLGLAVEVTGRGERTNLPRRFMVTVNVPWNVTYAQMEEYIREQLISGNVPWSINEYESIQPTTMSLAVIGGALVQRQAATYTMPG